METEGNAQLDIVAQRWPDIELPEASRLLRALARPLIAQQVVSHSGRPTAAASLVRTDEGLVFIKRYARSVRDADTIAPYHRYVDHLADRGIATPRFLRFRAGDESAPASEYQVAKGIETVAIQADSAYEAYFAADGEDRYAAALTWDPPRSLQEARNLGAWVARIDRASEGFEEPRLHTNAMSNTFTLFGSRDLEAAWRRWIADRPAVSTYLSVTNRDIMRDMDVVRPYAERVARHYAVIPGAWTHGDPHASNFLWEGDAPSAVIDFGLADRNTAVFDLAMLLERHAIQWVDVMEGREGACRPDMAEALLEGYRSVRELSEDEKRVLPDLLPISQAEAGLNWLQYYMNGTGRMQDAAWCYDVCFLAHTAWFSTPHGIALLDRIRECLG